MLMAPVCSTSSEEEIVQVLHQPIPSPYVLDPLFPFLLYRPQQLIKGVWKGKESFTWKRGGQKENIISSSQRTFADESWLTQREAYIPDQTVPRCFLLIKK